jgi:hypothetical protein
MPAESSLLTAFQRRDTIDKLMFGFVQGAQRMLPGVGVEKALSIFAKEYHLDETTFNLQSQKVRYQRMLKEFYEDRKTKTHGQES